MGLFFNPGNVNFAVCRNGDYIDKSGLIGVINDTLGRREKLSLVSRPRRFGKSYAAAMLAAYYGKGCDSAGLFYAAPYLDMDADILLVGIAYDSADPEKRHACAIEELDR